MDEYENNEPFDVRLWWLCVGACIAFWVAVFFGVRWLVA